VSGSDPGITHVADTALWVATYRAIESERPDALFRDPLAGRLAGERGKKIAEKISYRKFMAWLMVVRTVAIDELIKRAIAEGIDTVVNLGAGLDTRPYRMDLPSSLRWIEIDFPQMIQYKKEKLQSEFPRCRLEHIPADLADVPLRRQIFERIGSEAKKVLLITEGVISPGDAELLSRDLFAVPSCYFWIQDYRQGGFRQMTSSKLRRNLKDSPFRFDVEDSFAFFAKQGWRIFEKRIAADEADRIGRPFPFIFPWTLVLIMMPKKIFEKFRNAAGYVMYART
jgi:O-methyltransferase involved in polyketide biosynthesis